MKFLIVDHYYPLFLENYYRRFKPTHHSYQYQHQHLMNEMFSTADFYAQGLRKVGHAARTIVVNDDVLQAAWLKEFGYVNLSVWQKFWDSLREKFPFWISRKASYWQLGVLKQQIEYYQPDVLYLHNLSYLPQNFLHLLKPNLKLIVGQIACPIPPFQSFTAFDLIITSLPHYVAKFQRRGVPAEYLPLCIEPNAIKKIQKRSRTYPLTFVGGMTSAHHHGTQLIQNVAKHLPLEIWGYGREFLQKDSQAWKHHHGEVWGKKMYQLFFQSQITLNRHSSVAQNYANNLRLFEATACGALLLTDQKSNLNQLFTIDQEVVTYKNSHELMAKVKFFLTHQRQRQKIARAGQRRTLKEHTYQKRMGELIKILERYL